MKQRQWGYGNRRNEDWDEQRGEAAKNDDCE